MVRRTLAFCAAALLLAIGANGAERSLNDSFPAATVTAIQITNGVGDVAITAADAPEITVDVTLVPRRGGLFSSYRSAERDVESARLSSRMVDGRLELAIDSESEEPRFEARWVVVAPAATTLALELGVGDLTVRGIAGGVETELGVGDAVIEVIDGDVELELGVGDATVRGPARHFGSIESSAGVGSTDVVVQDQRVSGEGFVGQSSSWQGEGPHRISVEVGVGDSRVVLD